MQWETLIRLEGEDRYGFGGLFGRSFYGLMLYEHEVTMMDKAVEGNTAQ